MLHIRVVDLSRHILFILWHKLFALPHIARLLLEYSPKFSLGLLDVIEGAALVHALLTDSAVTGRHDVESSVRIDEHLHLVKDIVSPRTICQVNLRHVDVPRLLLFVVVDLVLLLIPVLNV